ncbi:hypothetical protein MIDIC_20004 [Alphaproteobacteria bacterium]
MTLSEVVTIILGYQESKFSCFKLSICVCKTPERFQRFIVVR